MTGNPLLRQEGDVLPWEEVLAEQPRTVLLNNYVLGVTMLDKSVPYKRIIMQLDHKNNKINEEIHLPEGYSFRMYEPGMEEDWAITEVEVLEFDNREKALAYFRTDLIPYQEQLKKRMVFIVNQEGIPVANACAWYVNYKGRHQAQVHYVAVRPKYQGMGLGKAVFMKVLSVFTKVEPDEDIYLHTQTWSHKAIRMYLKMGFRLITDDRIGYHDYHYEEAVKVLETVYDEQIMNLVKKRIS